jgi:pyridoxine kinase
MIAVLSIQSSVAYGHAGNSAAVFPLMRLGVEVWPVLTVHFSNHTGYGAWRGPMLAAADIAEVVAGIDDRGVLPRCDAVLSGYQGGADVGEVILEAVRLVKSRNPVARYCCDPVLGDVGRGFFVRPGVPELMRDRVVPAADIVTPNHFELEFLTGRPASTLAEVLAAADELIELGPSVVLVTSVRQSDALPDTVSMLAVDPTGAYLVTTPLLPGTYVGTGDVTAAMFLAHLLRSGETAEALGATAGVVFGLLAATAASGAAELQLVAAQDEIVAPTHSFEVQRIR